MAYGVLQGMLVSFWLGTFSLVTLQLVTGFFLLAHGLFFLPALWLVRRLSSLRSLALALAWVLFEYLRSLGYWGYPWGLWGTAPYHFLTLLQTASLAGVWGVSFVVVLLNAGAASALSGALRGEDPWPGARALLASAAVLAGLPPVSASCAGTTSTASRCARACAWPWSSRTPIRARTTTPGPSPCCAASPTRRWRRQARGCPRAGGLVGDGLRAQHPALEPGGPRAVPAGPAGAGVPGLPARPRGVAAHRQRRLRAIHRALRGGGPPGLQRRRALRRSGQAGPDLSQDCTWCPSPSTSLSRKSLPRRVPLAAGFRRVPVGAGPRAGDLPPPPLQLLHPDLLRGLLSPATSGASCGRGRRPSSTSPTTTGRSPRWRPSSTRSTRSLRAVENARPLLRATASGLTGYFDVDGSLRAAVPYYQEHFLVVDVAFRSAGHDPLHPLGGLAAPGCGGRRWPCWPCCPCSPRVRRRL